MWHWVHRQAAGDLCRHRARAGLGWTLRGHVRQITGFFARGLIVQLMVGLAAGLVGALAVGRVLESVLVGTGSRDPLTFVVTAALLVSVSIAACVIPARRAARLDPMASLRMD